MTLNAAGPALSIKWMRTALSPVELPPRVSERVPAPEYTMSPVLLKTRAALFCAPPARMLLPYWPLLWIVALPARVKRRLVETEGVCVVW